MTRLVRLVLPVAAFAVLAACGKPATEAARTEAPAPAPAAETPAPAAPAPAATWASLEPLVGKYPHDSGLLDNSVITPDLKALLGDRYEAFKTNMQTQSPLTREGGVLFTSGNKQHEGGSEMAYLLIAPDTRFLEVGLWQGGKLTTYKTPGSDLPKPKDIQTLIDNAKG